MKSQETVSEVRTVAETMLETYGVRRTRSRIEVLRTLLEFERPMTHGEVARRIDCDRATVFRTLRAFVSKGLVRRFDAGDRVYRYGLASGPSGPTFACSACGRVDELQDIELVVDGRLDLPDAIQKGEVELQLRGLCDDCVDELENRPGE